MPNTKGIKRYSSRAAVPNADWRFWPGRFVKVRLILETQKGAVLVPATATQTSAKGLFVYVVKDDSTAELRYLVLPERPAGTDGWTEERLAALVTRDAMVGVAKVLPPKAAEPLRALARSRCRLSVIGCRRPSGTTEN